MAEILYVNADHTLGFGDPSLKEKTKLSDFAVDGDLYKVKTFCELTKLEKNDGFVYESVPGTKVTDFMMNDQECIFTVSGDKSTQITLELAPEASYSLENADGDKSFFNTNISGKLTLNFDLEKGVDRKVIIRKV